MNHSITVADRTRRVRRSSFLKTAVAALLDAEDQPPSTVELLITDEIGMRELNRRYHGIDRATDVLSFPAGEGPETARLLGEVAICLPIAEEQARERSIPLESEIACLAIHGCLHLLGYDDDNATSRTVMIEKMNRVVTSLGYPVVDDWGSIYVRN